MHDVELDVYLLNGHQITVLVSSKASTDSVLEVCCELYCFISRIY